MPIGAAAPPLDVEVAVVGGSFTELIHGVRSSLYSAGLEPLVPIRTS